MTVFSSSLVQTIDERKAKRPSSGSNVDIQATHENNSCGYIPRSGSSRQRMENQHLMYIMCVICTKYFVPMVLRHTLLKGIASGTEVDHITVCHSGACRGVISCHLTV